MKRFVAFSISVLVCTILSATVHAETARFTSVTAIDGTSDFPPAVAFLSNKQQLVVAWTDRKAPHNICLRVCTVWANNIELGPKHVLTIASAGGPAVAAGPHGRVYLAYLGVGAEANTLHFTSGVVQSGSGELEGFTTGRSLDEYSPYSPALAGDIASDVVVLAWTGTDESSQVNRMGSRDGGATFDPVTKTVLPQFSITSPAVTLIPGNGVWKGMTFVYWTGGDENHSLNSIANIDSPDPQGQWRDKIILPEVSPFAPAGATGFNLDQIGLAWTGYDAERHLNLYVADPTALAEPQYDQSKKLILDQTSIAAPSLCSLSGLNEWGIAWLDRNHKIQVGRKTF